MIFSPEYLTQLANGIVTAVCGVYLLKYLLNKETRATFFFFWAVAFFLYGAAILLRLGYTFESPLVIATYLLMGLFFVVGTSLIIQKKEVFLLSYSGLVAITFFSYFYLGPLSPLSNIAGLYFYMLMIIASIALRAKLGPISNWFIIGWTILLFVNVLYRTDISSTIVDGFSGVSKIVILYGMTKPRFAYLVYNYEQLETKRRKEAVILSEQKRIALARETGKYGLDKGGAESKRRFNRFDDKTLEEGLSQRLLQSFLDVAIASLLAKKNEATGYEIVLYLHNKYGVLYSPGTIYPILRGMENKGLINGRFSGHRKPYALTVTGKQWYKEILKKFPEVIKALYIK